MRFLIDNQLPVALAIYLRRLGHDCLHVLDAGLDEVDDRIVWQLAIRDNRVLVSKDVDFTFLANLAGDTGRFLWIRLGNCRNEALVRSIERALNCIIEAFDAGQRIVELF